MRRNHLSPADFTVIAEFSSNKLDSFHSISLLDKSEGNEFSGQFDKAWGTLKDYSDCLGIEVSERVNLSNMLASCLTHQAQQLARVQQDVKVCYCVCTHASHKYTYTHTHAHPLTHTHTLTHSHPHTPIHRRTRH